MAYDDQKYFARQQIAFNPNLTGLSVPGTAASDTVLLRIPVSGVTITAKGMRMRLLTGGTAAGPTITVGKSLAGTGAVVACGTYAFGTSADGAVADVTITETNFSDNDEIVISNLAGTAASTPKIVFTLDYVNAYIG